jgi:hypothetical protein
LLHQTTSKEQTMRRLLVLLPALLALQVGVSPALAWTWPVDGPVLQQFSFTAASPYEGGLHRGIDVGAPPGAVVVAPAAGTVSFAGSVPTGGPAVTIQTTDGYSVTLVHLGSFSVDLGQQVAEAAPVGTVGGTGSAELSAPHVHLGIRVTNEPEGYLDPLLFLPSRTVADVSAPTPVEAVEEPTPLEPAPPTPAAGEQSVSPPSPPDAALAPPGSDAGGANAGQAGDESALAGQLSGAQSGAETTPVVEVPDVEAPEPVPVLVLAERGASVTGTIEQGPAATPSEPPVDAAPPTGAATQAEVAFAPVEAVGGAPADGGSGRAKHDSAVEERLDPRPSAPSPPSLGDSTGAPSVASRPRETTPSPVEPGRTQPGSVRGGGSRNGRSPLGGRHAGDPVRADEPEAGPPSPTVSLRSSPGGALAKPGGKAAPGSSIADGLVAGLGAVAALALAGLWWWRRGADPAPSSEAGPDSSGNPDASEIELEESLALDLDTELARILAAEPELGRELARAQHRSG